MLKNKTINLKTVEKVAIALEEINKDVIYVGGAVVSLYATDAGSEPPRPTKDIDISVQISSYQEMDEFRELLSRKGIFPASEESVLYRYKYDDILIDFIPYEDTPLGPTNRWLKPGFSKAYPIKIGSSEIKILPASLFLATKWEAYKNRGADPRWSPDFEDIIYVIDNNSEVIDVVSQSDSRVRDFLKEMCDEILGHGSLNEIIECHINPFTAEKRRRLVIEKLKTLSSL